MNDKNFDYLSKQLQYTGFGQDLAPKLKEEMQKGESQFSLAHIPEFAKDHAAAILFFKKSDTQDNYFFNRYQVQVTNPHYPDAIRQTFHLNALQDNITLKEAYNLLQGRAVHKQLTPKEGEKYAAWVQLDFKHTDANGNYKFKQFHQNYGYDLPATLSKLPIVELRTEEQAKRLVQSLERGNRQAVTFEQNGREVKAHVEAAPQFKSLNYYNEQHRRIDAQTITAAFQPGQTQHQQEKQTPSRKPTDEEAPAKRTRKSPKQSM